MLEYLFIAILLILFYFIIKLYSYKKLYRETLEEFRNYRHEVKNDLVVIENKLYKLKVQEDSLETYNNLKEMMRSVIKK